MCCVDRLRWQGKTGPLPSPQFPRLNKRTLPHPRTPATDILFVVHIVRRISPVRKRPATPNHLSIDVIRPRVADGDAPFIAVTLFTLADNPVSLDNFGQSESSHVTVEVF